MSDGSGSSNGGDDSDDDEFFDASRKVVELDGDDDEFSVELFSHDERVQKPSLPSLPDLEADDPRQFRSMRAAFRTTLPTPSNSRDLGKFVWLALVFAMLVPAPIGCVFSTNAASSSTSTSYVELTTRHCTK